METIVYLHNRLLSCRLSQLKRVFPKKFVEKVSEMEREPLFRDYIKNHEIAVGDSLLLEDGDLDEIALGRVVAVETKPKINVVVEWDGQVYQSEKIFCETALRKSGKKIVGGYYSHLFVIIAGAIQRVAKSPTERCVVRIVGPKEVPLGKIKEYADRKNFVNATSRSTKVWSRGLSPFYLGPCDLHGGKFKSNIVENAWQFTKVFPGFEDEKTGDPSEKYWAWAQEGWNSKEPIRYPMGRGKKPLYCWYNGKRLAYVDSRKQIYAPTYAKAVEQTEAFQRLRRLYETEREIIIWDFDGYDYLAHGKTLEECLNDTEVIMGHAFVLAMLLTENRLWEQ